MADDPSMLRRLFSCDRIARQRSIRSSIPRNLLPDTKEYAITAVRPGNLATVGVDTGYEIQIDEEARGDTRKGELDGFLYNRTGAVYKIKTIGTAPGQQNYTNNQKLAPGVWHSYDIAVTDRTYEVLLNGQPCTKFTADAGDPIERFRGRKKSEDPESGFVGLQVHTGNVAFANIRIKA